MKLTTRMFGLIFVASMVAAFGYVSLTNVSSVSSSSVAVAAQATLAPGACHAPQVPDKDNDKCVNPPPPKPTAKPTLAPGACAPNKMPDHDNDQCVATPKPH